MQEKCFNTADKNLGQIQGHKIKNKQKDQKKATISIK